MSDQRIKIENAIACAFGIGWNVQHDGVIKSSQLYIDKRNDCIHRYADEIESLIRSHTAPRELVDVVTDLLTIIDAEIDQSTWRKDSPFAVALNNARVALSGREPKEARP